MFLKLEKMHVFEYDIKISHHCETHMLFLEFSLEMCITCLEIEYLTIWSTTDCSYNAEEVPPHTLHITSYAHM